MKCPVCQRENVYFWSEINRFSEPLYIYKCNNCYSLHRHPLPDDPDLFYDKQYYTGRAEYSYKDERERFAADQIVHRARVRNIARSVKEGRFLDVGCSFGALVYAAAERFEAHGLDVSEYAVTEGRRFLRDVDPDRLTGLHHGSLTSLPDHEAFRENSFDVITMIEVAEHLAEPEKTFRAARRLLSPGGLLVIQTADFEGRQAVKAGTDYHYFLPGHLVYYTSTALKNLLRKTGFSSFKEYRPVDFSFLAKARKASSGFNSLLDYIRLCRIAKYHYLSMLTYKGRPLTSSYVLYAYV